MEGALEWSIVSTTSVSFYKLGPSEAKPIILDGDGIAHPCLELLVWLLTETEAPS